MRCRSCSEEVPGPSRFCPSCGVAVTAGSPASMVPTVAISAAAVALSSSSSVDEGRFLPGELVAGRYRIIGLLGRGGMGEVYRASDLKLGQQVALKFLPESASRDERALARFHAEVRIARQVSHPNVCRVYDIGEANGLTYLSMEYVDGEDLGSLLRRIGRLPADKATEIARRLCAGLAAAHDKGVIHRDLKPANIMIDGRGQVRITDFGLAAIADQVGADVRSGTPAYMAPEQLAGREGSARSDIYSLGLVLYEMFTGHRAFEADTVADLKRLQEQSSPDGLSSTAKDIDPAVDRVVLRCLQPDPRNRPAFPLAVAAALPGGDPLTAALAAGETPSPELVAAAGETQGLRPLIAVACFAAVLIGVIAAVALSPKAHPLPQLENPPEVLEVRIRDFLAQFGYADPPADRFHIFYYSQDYLAYAAKHRDFAVRAERLTAARPQSVHFFYRQSRQPLLPRNFVADRITPSDPPPLRAGMISAETDLRGRLFSLEVAPPQVENPPGEPRPCDWNPMFAAAGLDPSRFTPAAPQWIPVAAFDMRAAWTGSYPEAPDIPIRVEAAAWRGKPVYFDILGEWSRPWRSEPYRPTSRERANIILVISLFLGVVGAAAFLARRNALAGRGDRRGAVRLAFFIFSIALLQWLFESRHVAMIEELLNFCTNVGYALFLAGLVWILYMAIEPYVRRWWPHTLISWTRLLSGGFRDPVVGRDLLVGVLAGAAWSVLFLTRDLGLSRYGDTPVSPRLSTLLGYRHTIADALALVPNAVGVALGIFCLVFLLRLLLRRAWLAVGVTTLIFIAVPSLTSKQPAVSAAFAAASFALLFCVLLRYGLLPLVAGMYVSSILSQFPLTTNLGDWSASPTIFASVVVLALAAWGVRTSLAGRPLFALDHA